MYGKHPQGPQGLHVHNAREEARLAPARPSTPGTDMLGPGLAAIFAETALEAATADWGQRWKTLTLGDIETVEQLHPDAGIRERARIAAAQVRRRARKAEEVERTKAAAAARKAARSRR